MKTLKLKSRTLRALFAACGAVLVSLTLSADVSYRIFGPTLKVMAPAGSAGDRIVFVWDTEDKGDDAADWAHSAVVTESVPTGGADFTLDLAELGVTEGVACGLISTRTYQCLDQLGTFDGAYVDTGVKDTDCYGVAFGFYATEKTKDWGYFIGTYEADGFVMGNNSSNFASWNWAYRTGKKTPRPSVNTDSVNEVSFHDAQFWLNGERKASSLGDGSVGLHGSTMFVGRADFDSRIQYGWWTHVEFAGSDGKNLIEYVPVQQGDGTVGFYDKVSNAFVPPTSGTFTAGTATGATIARVLPHQAFTAKDCAPITLVVEGVRLVADVPAYFGGAQLVLVWDDVDKGDGLSDWGHLKVLAPVIPAGGGIFSADLVQLGVKNGQHVSIIALHKFKMLDKVCVAGSSYVDTGVKDLDCYRATFGFYAEASDYTDQTFGILIGTDDSNGFCVSLNYGMPDIWYWRACGYRSDSTVRPTVSTTAINEADISKAAFIVNGKTKKSNLTTDVIGSSGYNIYIGKASNDSRHQAGWWSHIELADSAGKNLVEYVPVQREGDDKVGFYDCVSGRFIGPSGTGNIVAGTVTNESMSVVIARSVTVPRIDEPLTLSVSDGKLAIHVPATFAQERLILEWNDQSTVLKDVIPATGGIYETDLQALGIGKDDVCKVVVQQQLQLLSQLKMPDETTYVDTGIPDSWCYRVSFGFYGNENKGAFGSFIGTREANNDPSVPGFMITMNNTALNSWLPIYQGMKYDRPSVNTDSINEGTVGNGVFVLNGRTVKSGLPVGPVGRTGLDMFLGTRYEKSTYLFGWWSYVSFADAGGNAILDYLPAKRVADGKVGFLDRVSGSFVTSTGGGEFTAGVVTNESFAAIHAQRTFSVGGLVASAVWTGAGAGLTDPESWTCRNYEGDTVSGIPTAETEVVIPSGSAFSVPLGAAFVCGSLELPSELVTDCDLRGVTFDKLVNNRDVDVKGHVFSVAMNSDATQTMTVTDTVGGGAFRVYVPTGSTVANATVVLTGNLAVAKEGDGTFVATKKNQTYSGGTEIVGGTFVCGGKGSEGVYGVADGVLTVRPDAAFDCNGYNGHAAAKLVLAGGELCNTRAGTASDDGWFADVTLTADSFVRAGRSFAIQPAKDGQAALEMNGFTLTVDVENGGDSFGFRNLTVTGGGMIFARSGGWVDLDAVMAATTTMDVDYCALNVLSVSTFLNYIAHFTGNWDKRPDVPIKVLGRFAPIGTAWHSVELQGGAILDLSSQSGVWAGECRKGSYEGTSTLSFVPGSTVKVAVGDRQIEMDEQIVSWTSKPEGVKNTTLVWADEAIQLPISARSKGIFASKPVGLILIVE